MAEAGFFNGDAATVHQTTQRHEAIQGELEAAFARWDELEDSS